MQKLKLKNLNSKALMIARTAAIKHREEHEYIPKGYNILKFKPHAWVLTAIRMALEGQEELIGNKKQ